MSALNQAKNQSSQPSHVPNQAKIYSAETFLKIKNVNMIDT
jgi:hypothetical protein